MSSSSGPASSSSSFSTSSGLERASKEQEVHTHTHTHTHTYHHRTQKALGMQSTSPTDLSAINTSRVTQHSANPNVSGDANHTGNQMAATSTSRLLEESNLLNLSSASSHRSVRDALAELNLKTRLLEDERDYYVNLYNATEKAYEQHRRELQSLFVKERNVFSTALREAEEKLAALRDENEKARKRRAEEKDEIMAEMQRLQAQAKADDAARMAQMRAEIDEQSATLKLMKSQTDLLLGEKEGLEDEIRDLLRRQEELRAELMRRKAEQRALLDAGRATKPFIPGGKTQKDDYTPASHNLNALVSTIHHRNFLLPGENKRFKSPTHIFSPAEEVCGAILKELMDLRLEYHLLAEQLNNPHADVTATSTRLREILQTVERKKSQLRKMRASQKSRSDVDKLHVMLKAIATQNNMAEQLYSDLITCIRTPY